MMVEQGTLFGIETLVPRRSTKAPLCGLCRLAPRAMDARTGGYHRYCAGRKCGRVVRLCHICNELFNISDPDTGTKYCGTKCKERGYGWGKPEDPTPKAPCNMCGKAMRFAGRTCMDCRKQRPWLNALFKHHAPLWLIEYMETDGHCMNRACGRDLRIKVKTERGWRLLLHVDHDHRHCPKNFGCGECVRGVLCGTCNQALGLLRDKPDVIRGLAEYANK